jgi:hypothetical protein
VEGARAANGGRAAGWAQLAAAAVVAAGLGGDLPAGEVTRLVASTLAAAGAIGHDFAAATVDDLDAALAARGITTARPDRGPGMPAWPLLTPPPALGQPAAGPMWVAPVTARLPAETRGQRVGLALLAYAQAPGAAILVGSARVPDHPSLRLHAVDDQERHYQLALQRDVAGDALWEGELSPPPQRAAPRWLEVATGAAGEPVRIDLGVPASHAAARREPVAARGKGELLAEAAAAGLLATALMPIPSARGAVARAEAEARGVGSVVTVLLALGLLRAGSPALRRLAALGERLGIGFPVPASGLAQPAASLPEPWQAVLADRDRRDGRSAITRVAAALPELDGARIALTALESAPDHTLLHLLAVGWDPPGFGLRAFTETGGPPLSWWARDSAGRWHTASGGSWGRHGDRQWAGMLRLRPPLHPAATSLELTITGRSERLRIMVPLDWHAEGPE